MLPEMDNMISYESAPKVNLELAWYRVSSAMCCPAMELCSHFWYADPGGRSPTAPWWSIVFVQSLTHPETAISSLAANNNNDSYVLSGYLTSTIYFISSLKLKEAKDS